MIVNFRFVKYNKGESKFNHVYEKSHFFQENIKSSHNFVFCNNFFNLNSKTFFNSLQLKTQQKKITSIDNSITPNFFFQSNNNSFTKLRTYSTAINQYRNFNKEQATTKPQREEVDDLYIVQSIRNQNISFSQAISILKDVKQIPFDILLLTLLRENFEYGKLLLILYEHYGVNNLSLHYGHLKLFIDYYLHFISLENQQIDNLKRKNIEKDFEKLKLELPQEILSTKELNNLDLQIYWEYLNFLGMKQNFAEFDKTYSLLTQHFKGDNLKQIINIVLLVYSKVMMKEKFQSVWDSISNFGLSHSTKNYNSLFVLCKNVDELIYYFEDMISKGVHPNATTFQILLSKFAKSKNFLTCQKFINEIIPKFSTTDKISPEHFELFLSSIPTVTKENLLQLTVLFSDFITLKKVIPTLDNFLFLLNIFQNYINEKTPKKVVIELYDRITEIIDELALKYILNISIEDKCKLYQKKIQIFSSIPFKKISEEINSLFKLIESQNTSSNQLLSSQSLSLIYQIIPSFIESSNDVKLVNYFIEKIKKLNEGNIPTIIYPSLIRFYAKIKQPDNYLPLLDLFEKEFDNIKHLPTEDNNNNENINNENNININNNEIINLDDYEKLYNDIAIELCKVTLNVDDSLQLIKKMEKRGIDCHPSLYYSLFNWAIASRDFAKAETMLINQSILPDVVVVICYKKLLNSYDMIFDIESADRIKKLIAELKEKLPSDIGIDLENLISPSNNPQVRQPTFLEGECRKQDELFLTNLILSYFK